MQTWLNLLVFSSLLLVKLTDGVQSVFSPRFNYQGDKLVYFESTVGWAHHTCASLKMVLNFIVCIETIRCDELTCATSV